jgi:hypothetical protein
MVIRIIHKQLSAPATQPCLIVAERLTKNYQKIIKTLKMKWPSTKFFQGLAGASFLMGGTNLIINIFKIAKSNTVQEDQITEIHTQVADLSNKVSSLTYNQVNKTGNFSEQNIISTGNQLFENLKNIEKQIYDSQGLTDITNKLSEAVNNISLAKYKLTTITDQLNNAMLNNKQIEYNILLAEKAKLEAFYNQNLNYILTNVNTHLQNKMIVYKELAKNISNSRQNFLGDNIWEKLDQFNNWLNSLSLQENLAFVNMSGIIFIMITLFSIIMIFYGNKLLNYFQLEDRFPRIAKLIILRRKFQEYYLITNILLISVVLIIMFALNLLVFIYN